MGIIARSFGNLEVLTDVCNFLLAEAGVEKIFHLGLYRTDPDLYIRALTGREEKKEDDFLEEVSEFLEEKLEEEDLNLRLLSAQDGKKRLKKSFIKIAGPGEEPASDEEKARLEVVGRKFVILTPEPHQELVEDDSSPMVICTSAWSKPLLRRERHKIILCPGHLSDPSSSSDPTFATMKIEMGRATFTFYNLKFKKILEKAVPLEDTRFTVR